MKHQEPARKMPTNERLAPSIQDVSDGASQGSASDAAFRARLAELAAWGVDLGLIRLNLSWTPAHRLEIMAGIVEAGRQMRQSQVSQQVDIARVLAPLAGEDDRSPTLPPRFSPMLLFRRLEAARVRYVCTGSLAAILQGVPCVTELVELCCGPAPANLTTLLRVLKGNAAATPDGSLGPGSASALALALRHGGHMELETPAANVILMSQVPGIGPFAAVWRHAHLLDLDGLALPVSDLEAILASKRKAPQAGDAYLLPHLEATILIQRLERPRQQREMRDQGVAEQQPH